MPSLGKEASAHQRRFAEAAAFPKAPPPDRYCVTGVPGICLNGFALPLLGVFMDFHGLHVRCFS
jgi:hypothetical protein